MHIADILHDLIHHSTAFASAANREEAHQVVDDRYPDHGSDSAGDAEPVEAPAPDPQTRIAELEAELEKELEQKAHDQPDTGA